jgi:hypothetical protein
MGHLAPLRHEQLLVHMRSRSSLIGFLRTRQGDSSIRMAAFDRDFVEHMVGLGQVSCS